MEDFYFDKPSTNVTGKAPMGFSAAKSASLYNENVTAMSHSVESRHAQTADHAGFGGGGGGAGVGGGVGGGSDGPALPFRVKKVNLFPRQIANDSVFSDAHLVE
mmetsp:Transcript_122912/g.191956  ORF Transcript_122912/g.191956 Transcript_122912/m.191956 type:complete len:104 (+) Transcript_122912:45-356(+)